MVHDDFFGDDPLTSPASAAGLLSRFDQLITSVFHLNHPCHLPSFLNGVQEDMPRNNVKVSLEDGEIDSTQSDEEKSSPKTSTKGEF